MLSRLDTIKREARKEAWYGDSYNPFRKNNRRSNTWAGQNPRDIEANPQQPQDSPGEPLSASQTEPPYRYDHGEGADRPSSKDNEMRMTSARTTTNSHGEKVRGASSEETGETAVDNSTPSQEEAKPRKRFGFHKHEKNNEEDDDKPKKRPWYKGKVLKHKPYTVRNQLEATIFNSWINILLLAAPVGIGINYAGVNGTIIFVVNFIAIIPLAAMLSFATEEIALHVGESLGGLLNASFGNAVELIVAIIALAKDEITVVQTSLVGSILSNLLLVMGMCFFFGGLRRTEQFFNQTVAQTAASLLALAVGALIIPTCFDLFTNNNTTPQAHIASLSRGTAVILLVVYITFLYFQLSTHKDKFNEESKKVAMRPRKHAVPEGALAKGLAKVGGMGAGAGRPNLEDRPPNDELVNRNAYEDNSDEEEPEEPQLHIAVAWATLAGATAIIGLCAEFMVDGIGSITSHGVSVEFVGLILLPIVGNAAEHATAVTVACKDKMDLAIGVAVGSSMQIALGVIPLSVVIGWIMGKDDMTLDFDGFQVVVLFVAVLLVNYLTADGASNYLEGLMLQCLYLIIAVCAWYYPATNAV